jgi:hypothetical protein
MHSVILFRAVQSEALFADKVSPTPETSSIVTGRFAVFHCTSMNLDGRTALITLIDARGTNSNYHKLLITVAFIARENSSFIRPL